MIKPTISELSQGDKYNRYMLVMMAAKGAKYVTDREMYQKDHPEAQAHMSYDDGELGINYEDKPVKNAIRMFDEGKMFINLPPEAEKAIAIRQAEAKAAEEFEG